MATGSSGSAAITDATGTILVVDDDPLFRAALCRYLSRTGYEVEASAVPADAIELLEHRRFDLILSDLKMPGLDGTAFVRRARQIDPSVPCIVVTGFGSPERSIEALSAGAFWFLEKSYEQIDCLGPLVEKALDYRRLRDSNRRMQKQLEHRFGFDGIVGHSAAMEDTLDLVRKVADSDATVLVRGESGVGKELIARALHYNSPRSGGPFVPLNCGAIPRELMESELFGHVRGAFTGAVRDRTGRLAEANGGTLFLDEIGDMSLPLQVKVLRALQERNFTPLGSNRSTEVDVRIVAATHRDLDEMVAAGDFREDLFYRLAVIPIDVPPLRQRRDDIPPLVEFFLDQERVELPELKGMTETALTRLIEHEWPGNVRELQSMITRMAVLKRSGWIDEGDLLPVLGPTPSGDVRLQMPSEGINFDETMREIQRDLIAQALERAGGNRTQAAAILGMKRTTLVERMKKLGLNDGEHESGRG